MYYAIDVSERHYHSDYSVIETFSVHYNKHWVADFPSLAEAKKFQKENDGESYITIRIELSFEEQ